MNLGTATGRSVVWMPATAEEITVRGILARYRVTERATNTEQIVTERRDRREGGTGSVYECTCAPGIWAPVCLDIAAAKAAHPEPPSTTPTAAARAA